MDPLGGIRIAPGGHVISKNPTHTMTLIKRLDGSERGKTKIQPFYLARTESPAVRPVAPRTRRRAAGPAAAVCAGHQARHYGRHPPAGALGFDHHHPGAELQSVRAPEPHPGSDRDWPEGEIQKERCQKPDGNFWLPLRPRRFGRRAGDSASREAAAKSPERPGNLHPGLQRKGLRSILSASDRGPLTSRGRRAWTRGRPGPPESAHRIRVGPVAKGGFSGGGAGESLGLLVRALGPAFASFCVRK